MVPELTAELEADDLEEFDDLMEAGVEVASLVLPRAVLPLAVRVTTAAQISLISTYYHMLLTCPNILHNSECVLT